MIADCPSCARRWVLPADRIGRGGARVRCAACDSVFTWSPVRSAAAAFGPAELDPFERESRAWSDSSARAWFEPADAAAPAMAHETSDEDLHAASAVDELTDEDATPPMVTRLAIEELVLEGGPAMLAAWDEGRLFERCGTMIVRAWDHCRERLGSDADPAVFREALRARLGIGLPDGTAR